MDSKQFSASIPTVVAVMPFQVHGMQGNEIWVLPRH